MRTVLRGLLAGLVLSALRAPRGLDLFEFPVAGATTTLGWRAAALATCGVVLWAALRRPGFVLLASAAAGFALHGLVLGNLLAPRSTLALALVVAAGLALALVVCLDERKLDEPAEPLHTHRAAWAGEVVGLFAAGAGLALALEAVARHLRAFGDGLAQDDAVFGVAFLLLAALGAGTLGWLARLAPLRNLSLPLGLAASATACFVGLSVAAELVKVPTLDRYAGRFGLALVEHGTLAWDLLLGSTFLVAPALLAGFALAGARTGRQGAAVCFGAAQGLLLSGVLLRGSGVDVEVDDAWYAAQLVPFGALLAFAGAALAALSAAGPRPAVRYGALIALCALAVVPLTREVLGLPLRAPWDDSNPLAPRMYATTFDAPEGLATVETRGAAPPIATLDGRELTSGLADPLAELQRLQISAACVGEGRHARGALTALLVGALDPFRAVVLRQQGFTRIDRSVAWHGLLPRLEAQLFKSVPLPEGDVLAPGEARRRIAEGRYDLVLVPQVAGDAPALGALELDADWPAKTTLVAWIGTETPSAHLDLGETVLLSSDGLESLCIGIARNARLEEAPAPATAAQPMPVRAARAGAPRGTPTPLAQLSIPDGHRFRERTLANRIEWIERLADGARGTPDEPFFAGLLALYRAQERSSPFETPEQGVELPDAGLDLLLRHVETAKPDAFARGVWEAVARVLAGKRDVERVRRYVGPAARKHAPWPSLEKTLARADLEALEPEEAVKRLEAIAVLAMDDFDYWNLLGEARKAARDEVGATRAWRKALELRPAHQVLKRRLAMLLVRTGEPGGRQLIEQLLQAHPDDANLRAYLGPGPWPDEEPAGRP
jgi:hypothetical protein